MRTSEELKMMVRFHDQRRSIHVKPADSDDAVKQACFHIYNLDRTSGSRSFQIQFYLTEYQEFVDLETNEFEFRQLLALLASSEAPPTTDIRWRLRIIETTMNNTRSSSRWNICAVHPSCVSRNSVTSDRHWGHLHLHLLIPTSQWWISMHERSERSRKWKPTNPAGDDATFVYQCIR